MLLELNQREVQDAIETIISEQSRIMEELNGYSAYSQSECERKLFLMNKRSEYEYILRLFGLQTNDYFNKKDYVGVKIK